MFTKLLLTSVARVTVLGSLAAVALVAAPTTVTVAPEIRTVACGPAYPANIATTTALTIARPVPGYGVTNIASVKVNNTGASGAGNPTGTVQFRLTNPNGSLRKAWNRTLTNGQARVNLPRTLPAQATYRMEAVYWANGCFNRSDSGTKYASVLQARTTASVNAANVRRGTRPRVGVTVGSRSELAVGGRAQIIVKRRAVTVRKATVTLRGERAGRAFRKLRPGYYNVEVRYLGNRNYAKSKGTDDFRVFGRR